MTKVVAGEVPLKITCEFDEVEYFYILHLLNNDIGETRRCLEKVKKTPTEKHLAKDVEKGLNELITLYNAMNIFDFPISEKY